MCLILIVSYYNSLPLFLFFYIHPHLWLCIDVLDPLHITRFHFQAQYFPSCHEYFENGSCNKSKTSVHK